MRCDADHHCPPPCHGHLWRPVDRPRCDPRPPEATDHCGHARPRERDCYTPCPPADEHIPGRLAFDLYLLKGHRQARAAYAFQCGQARERDRCDGTDARHGPERTHDRRHDARSNWRPDPMVDALPLADQDAIRRVLTLLAQRGSLIDLLA